MREEQQRVLLDSIFKVLYKLNSIQQAFAENIQISVRIVCNVHCFRVYHTVVTVKENTTCAIIKDMQYKFIIYSTV